MEQLGGPNLNVDSRVANSHVIQVTLGMRRSPPGGETWQKRTLNSNPRQKSCGPGTRGLENKPLPAIWGYCDPNPREHLE